MRFDNEFRGKVAVITGGGSGIGRSTTLLLARLGTKVHVVDVDSDRAEAVAEEVRKNGGKAEAHAVDVTDEAAVAELAAAVYDTDGRVDILHNNAGIGGFGPVEDTPLEDWQRIIGINLMGVVHGIHVFVPRMLQQGGGAHIINTASGLGLIASPNMAPYVATKHAVVGLSQALNAELSGRDIFVTALCPGGVKTRIFEEGASPARGTGADERRAHIMRSADRFASDPEVIARAVVRAIRRRTLISTPPRHFVLPLWIVWRISPRLGQPMGRLLSRIAYKAP